MRLSNKAVGQIVAKSLLMGFAIAVCAGLAYAFGQLSNTFALCACAYVGGEIGYHAYVFLSRQVPFVYR